MEEINVTKVDTVKIDSVTRENELIETDYDLE